MFGYGGTYFNRNSAADRWKQAREAAGIGGFTLHDLRHFYASGLVADGCDVVTVQRALGHAQPSITLNTYSHLWPTAEDKTRTAGSRLIAAVLGDSADSVRTGEATSP
ncbi:tyrosine-type recombinase/integrase [Arthrobacter sp. GAS37]|uniref:tyrosine-type recombinase/integrase n=1 Tax=Arthrobacter sp. GAS37 TaxID=3156261 RepID=UPI00384D7C00